MNKGEKVTIWLGSLFAFTALVLNPWFIEYFFSPDQKFDFWWKYAVILFFDATLLMVGALLVVTIKKFSVFSVRVSLLLFSFLVCMVFLEIVLRYNPPLFGNDFANSILQKYTTSSDGIYFYNPTLHMHFMKPNFKTEMYFNGYRWQHATNNLGFRMTNNQTQADIVLLGDSQVYGHGLEYNQTIGHFLEDTSFKSIANLGTQGNGIIENALLFHTFALSFSPKYVFYFFFGNDLSDIHDSFARGWTFDSVDYFIEHDAKNVDVYTIKPSVDSSTASNFKLYTYVAARVFLVKIQNTLASFFRKGPRYTFSELDNTLFWDYTKKTILSMKSQADLRGITFVLAPIAIQYQDHPLYGTEVDTAIDFALNNDIEIVDLRSLSFDEKNYLPNDSHLSEQGAKTVAALVSAFINSHDK